VLDCSPRFLAPAGEQELPAGQAGHHRSHQRSQGEGAIRNRQAGVAERYALEGDVRSTSMGCIPAQVASEVTNTELPRVLVLNKSVRQKLPTPNCTTTRDTMPQPTVPVELYKRPRLSTPLRSAAERDMPPTETTLAGRTGARAERDRLHS
jgi:hypothetical protein